MILAVALFVVACGSETPAETTGADTTVITTPGSTEGTTPTTTKTNISTGAPESNPAVVTTAFLGHALLSDAQLGKMFCC